MKGRSAFSLIETMLALLIFTIGLLGLSQIPAIYDRLMYLSIEKENATLYAAEALDIVESMSSGDLDFFQASDLAANMDIPSGYTVALSVDSYSGILKMVRVTINCPSGIGKEAVSLVRAVTPSVRNEAAME